MVAVFVQHLYKENQVVIRFIIILLLLLLLFVIKTLVVLDQYV
ncbi:hypothetical protein SAMN04488505_102727 [Chitinophaga rupis]|uniref:Uncharacterized protein n=1 Tax=Chitinophaga rupis TaxID=573321 RepID=A0A1H7RTC4_9BACT|nr:hypothetical protein SAMN04488505_102727 [Chitinophaga rupis]